MHTNGGPTATPKKQESTLSKLFGWITGKKAKPENRQPLRPVGSGPSRVDFKENEPRMDRPRREERPRSEPTTQEISSTKLYIGNLAYEAAESDLFDLFSKVGAVKNVEIAMDRRSNRSKGFGFVEMESLETAKEAAAKLNRTDFMGRQIVVSGAKVDKRPSQSSNPREEDSTSHEHEAGSNPDATA
jgi:RNA recognition motif-containing protein